MNTVTAAIQRHREHNRHAVGTLMSSQVDDIFGWTDAVDGPLLARLLISQIASDADDLLAERCVEAILATDIPETLLGELVALVPPCRESLMVIARLLRVLQPDHALAHHDLGDRAPFALYDAIDDGTCLFVSATRMTQPLAVGSTGLLLGVESPTEQVASFRVVRSDPAGVHIEVSGDDAWLERKRFACPPLIAII